VTYNPLINASGYFLSAIRDFGKLVLEEVDIIFEAVFWSRSEREEVVATHLGFLASSILCEEGLVYLREVMKRTGW